MTTLKTTLRHYRQITWSQTNLCKCIEDIKNNPNLSTRKKNKLIQKYKVNKSIWENFITKAAHAISFLKSSMRWCRMYYVIIYVVYWQQQALYLLRQCLNWGRGQGVYCLVFIYLCACEWCSNSNILILLISFIVVMTSWILEAHTVGPLQTKCQCKQMPKVNFL